MAETPWFTSPPDAKLVWGNHLRDDLGYLHFIDPNGKRAVVWVSKTNTVEGEQFAGQNVWHIDIPDETPGALVTVSPSIHFIGHFHSPRPVQFRLVDELAGTVQGMAPEADNTTTTDAPPTTDAPAATPTSAPTPAPATDTTGTTGDTSTASDVPLSGPHEQAAGVETDPNVLAAPPADDEG